LGTTSFTVLMVDGGDFGAAMALSSGDWTPAV